MAKLTKEQEALRFTVSQLSTAYNVGANTVRKMIGDIPPTDKRGNAAVWKLCDVTTLNDVREPYVPQSPKEEVVETDPNKMKPMDRKIHYQAEDLKQAAEIKSRRNAVESRELIPAQEVEMALAQAFKIIALTLDTLPDALERDGYIGSADVESIIDILDSARDQLANDLSGLSPMTEAINDSGDW